MENQLAQLNEELAKNSTIRSCKLKAVMKEGNIVLVGRVYSYFQKQIATTLALKCVSQTFVIQNEIIVTPKE